MCCYENAYFFLAYIIMMNVKKCNLKKEARTYQGKIHEIFVRICYQINKYGKWTFCYIKEYKTNTVCIELSFEPYCWNFCTWEFIIIRIITSFYIAHSTKHLNALCFSSLQRTSQNAKAWDLFLHRKNFWGTESRWTWLVLFSVCASSTRPTCTILSTWVHAQICIMSAATSVSKVSHYKRSGLKAKYTFGLWNHFGCFNHT